MPSNKIKNPIFQEMRCIECNTLLGFKRKKYYTKIETRCVYCHFQVLQTTKEVIPNA